MAGPKARSASSRASRPSTSFGLPTDAEAPIPCSVAQSLPAWHRRCDVSQLEIAMPFDLILRGGRVIDPSQKLDTVTDVGFAGGKVAAVGQGLKADPGTD